MVVSATEMLNSLCQILYAELTILCSHIPVLSHSTFYLYLNDRTMELGKYTQTVPIIIPPSLNSKLKKFESKRRF